MSPSRLWAERTTVELGAPAMASAIAVLPVAATEQHGPHLPLGTDTFIMEGYLGRVLARLPADSPAVFLPTEQIGCSIEHGRYPGTLDGDARATLERWSRLVAAVARTGCRKLVIVNAHGGNSSITEILARETRARHDMLAVTASWQRFGYPDGLFTPAELAHGIHGGQVETALMLAFRPDLVRTDALRDFASTGAAVERDHQWLRVSGRPTGFGWLAGDLNPAGVVGDAAAATAALGERCADYGADTFVALLRDVERFDLATLSPPTA